MLNKWYSFTGTPSRDIVRIDNQNAKNNFEFILLDSLDQELSR